MDAKNQIDIPDPEDAVGLSDLVREFDDEFPEGRLAWAVIELAMKDLALTPTRLDSDTVTQRVEKLENHISAANYFLGEGFKEDADLLGLVPGFLWKMKERVLNQKDSLKTAWNERDEILKKAGGGTRLADLSTTKMADFARGPALYRKQSLFANFEAGAPEPDLSPLTPNFGRSR